MTQFVHPTDEKRIASVQRNGLKPLAVRSSELVGVYCTPVSRSGSRTHQWLRELKRRGIKTIVAVQFYLPSRERVLVGRYNQEHITVSASEALRVFEEHQSGLGLEVVVLRSITPKEIRRIYLPNPVSGWRFHPDAKGRKPFCGCRYCNRCEINAYRVITEE